MSSPEHHNLERPATFINAGLVDDIEDDDDLSSMKSFNSNIKKQQQPARTAARRSWRMAPFLLLPLAIVTFLLLRSATENADSVRSRIKNSALRMKNSNKDTTTSIMEELTLFGLRSSSSGGGGKEQKTKFPEELKSTSNSGDSSQKKSPSRDSSHSSKKVEEAKDVKGTARKHKDEDVSENSKDSVEEDRSKTRDDDDDEDDDDDDDDDEVGNGRSPTVLKPPPKPWTDNDRLTPKIVWLASYPNSGTSYTMTMVERATNVSTASNYGREVTASGDDSIPVYPQHPEGPFWDGLSGKMGMIRYLPKRYVMTKTHCGGRCVNCKAERYVSNVDLFLQGCQQTSGFRNNGEKFFESMIPASSIAGLIHLIRNPFHNIVARFHLESRHKIRKHPELANTYPSNATGFARWCGYLGTRYGKNDARVHTPEVQELIEGVPCYAEFFKWAQWHSLVHEMIPKLGDGGVPVLTVHYEDYEYAFDDTTNQIFDFLDQKVAASSIQAFRPLPTYEDHFTLKKRKKIRKLVKHVSSDKAWEQIRHYFED